MEMPNYQKMYYILCSGVKAILDDMEGKHEYESLYGRLKLLLNEAEDVYIDTANIIPLNTSSKEDGEDDNNVH